MTAAALTAAGPVVDDAALVADSRAVLAHHARSFRLAATFLPRAAADEAAVTYAFCRLVDDLADEAPDRETAARDLALVDDELSGRSVPRPLIAAYLKVAHSRGVPVAAARELLNGMLTDLDEVRVADDGELVRYCYRVAGTVGLMMCGVLGVTADEALHPAIDLGIGMQLTNICRDVLEDAQRGRVYLPASRLAAVGLSHDDVLDVTLADDLDRRARLAKVVAELLELAEGAYHRAFHGMHHIPARPRTAILVAATLYRDIGLRLRDVHGSDAIHGRTMVPTAGRAKGIAVGLLRSLSPVSWGIGTDRSADTLRPPLHAHLAGLGGAPKL